MRITINQQDLLKVLSVAFKAIPNKTATPILENFFLNVRDGVLHVVASDNEVGVNITCAAEGEGEACIPAKTLLELVKTLPASDVMLTTSGNVTSVSFGSGDYSIPCFPVDEYPSIWELPDNPGVSINAQFVANAMAHTIPHTGTDELRPNLRGVYMARTDSGIDFVASDTHTMTVFPVPGNYGDFESIIIPMRCAAMLKDLASGVQGDLRIAATGNAVFIRCGNSTIRATKMEGRYPNYKAVMPQDVPSVLVCDSSLLLSALRRVSVCANRASNNIKFVLNDSGCEISAQDLGFGTSASERLESAEYAGDAITIGFKSDYLIKSVSLLRGEKVSLRFKDERRAAEVKADQDLSTTIVMPVMIQ